jgi:uncharacterized protein YlxW (UPF0749 family)
MFFFFKHIFSSTPIIYKHWFDELPSLLLFGHVHFVTNLCVNSDMEIKNKAWQVAELEESKNNLLLENQQLRENMSGLHSTIQNLENSISSASQDASAKVCLCYL